MGKGILSCPSGKMKVRDSTYVDTYCTYNTPSPVLINPDSIFTFQNLLLDLLPNLGLLHILLGAFRRIVFGLPLLGRLFPEGILIFGYITATLVFRIEYSVYFDVCSLSPFSFFSMCLCEIASNLSDDFSHLVTPLKFSSTCFLLP